MKNILFSVMMAIAVKANCQFLTQSADGKGSIPLPLKGAGVAVDIGKTEVAFGVNNYNKVFNTVNNQWFWGANVTAKNKEGLGKLFNAGEIVPEASALFFSGYSISNNKRLSNKLSTSPLFDGVRDARKKIAGINASFTPLAINLLIKDSSKISDALLRDSIFRQLMDSLNNRSSIKELLKDFKLDKELKDFATDLLRGIELLEKDILRQTAPLREANKAIITPAYAKFFRQNPPWRLTIFLQGGIQAKEFKRFLGITTPDFADSFKDTLFRGGHFGLGANFHIGNFWIGATYSYVKTDNFSTLTSKEYTLRRSDTLTQVLTQEKKITAYPGKYARVETNELNIDLVYDFKINDTSRLMLNPYMRMSLHSRDTAYLKNSTNLGLGLYFLGKKRKFIGGLYVELPDINNNAEKAKATDEINIKPPFRKLSFGIVTRFNLSSIFNFENRKPTD